MKRFEFSLKKLLGFKEQILRKEKNDLANLRKQQHIIIEEKLAITEKKKQKNCELISQINKGINPQHMAFHKNYIESLNDQIWDCISQIELLDIRIQKQLNVIIEITKEIDSLEKLEGRQRVEYNKIEQKQNELFIEEFVSHKSFHEVK